MRTLVRLFICALGLCLAGVVARPAGAETWTAASEDDVPPFVYLDKGARAGLDIDLVDAVAHEAGIEVSYRGAPRNRVLQMLDRDKVDFGFSFVGSPGFSSRFILVGPLRLGRSALAGVAGTRIEFKQFGDLNRFVVATVQGYAYSPAFEHAPGLRKDQTATSQLLLLKKLIAERDDLIAGDADTLKALAVREGLTRRISFLPRLVEEAPRYIAFPKARADKARRFQAALDRLRAKGALDPIFDHWRPQFSNAPEMGQ